MHECLFTIYPYALWSTLLLPSCMMYCCFSFYLKVGSAHKATTFLLHAHHTSTSHPSIHYITTLHYNNRNNAFLCFFWLQHKSSQHSTGRGYCTILLYCRLWCWQQPASPAQPIAHTTINNHKSERTNLKYTRAYRTLNGQKVIISYDAAVKFILIRSARGLLSLSFGFLFWHD